MYTRNTRDSYGTNFCRKNTRNILRYEIGIPLQRRRYNNDISVIRIRVRIYALLRVRVCLDKTIRTHTVITVNNIDVTYERARMCVCVCANCTGKRNHFHSTRFLKPNVNYFIQISSRTTYFIRLNTPSKIISLIFFVRACVCVCNDNRNRGWWIL